MKSPRLALGSILTLMLVGLVACTGAPVPNASSPTPPLATSMPSSGPGGAAHVMVIVEENHSYSQIIGNASLPYINSLATQYGSATNWWGLSHPSEPNYLGMMSGSIWDNPPDRTPQQETYSGTTFVDQLAAAGIGWKAYIEDMPKACDLTDTFSPGYYDVNHNPFMYFTSLRHNPAQCNRDVPYPQLATDLADNSAPSFLFVTPSLLHDMHDGTYSQADQWLRGMVSSVLASRWYKQGGIVILTWDEGGSPSDRIPTIVISAHTSPGSTLTSFGNHYGMLRTLEETYGLRYLGHAADGNVGDLRNLF